MVVGVVTHFLKVVMLSADAQTLLSIGTAAWFGLSCAQDNVFPLVHSSIGKHKRGVILDDHRSRWHDGMSVLFEEFLVRLSDFVRCHHCLFYKVYPPSAT